MKRTIFVGIILCIFINCFGDPQKPENTPKTITMMDCGINLAGTDNNPVMVGGKYKDIPKPHRIHGSGFYKAENNFLIGIIPGTQYSISARKPYLEHKSSIQGTVVFSSNINEQIDLILTLDKRYTTTRGIKISDKSSRIIELYGEPNKKMVETTYSIFEYRLKITHEYFDEVVLAFKIEKNIVTAVAAGGIYKNKFILTEDDFSFIYGAEKVSLSLNAPVPNAINITAFKQQIYGNDGFNDFFAFRGDDLDFGYRRGLKKLTYMKIKSGSSETKRGLRVGDKKEKLIELYGGYFDAETTNSKTFELTYRDQEGGMFFHHTCLSFYLNNGIITRIVVYNELFEDFESFDKVLSE